METLLCKAFYSFLHVYEITVLFIAKGKRTKIYDAQVQAEGEVAFSKYRCFMTWEVEYTQSFGRPNFYFSSSEKFKKIAHINIEVHVLKVLCETQVRRSRS